MRHAVIGAAIEIPRCVSYDARMRMSLIVVVVVSACSGPTKAPPSEAPPSETPPNEAPPPTTEPPPTQSANKPDGAGCVAASECASGVCEGEGCAPDKPGKCASRARVCTQDLQPYCGCDGSTFRSSGSCPGQRFASRGDCKQSATKKPDGAACVAASECTSGTCEGEGCTADKPGKCAPRARACTKDLRRYCGCDGTTFQASGSCPGQRFASRGECTQQGATKKPDGAACVAASECTSGTCEGEGCTADKPGKCAPRMRACTKDLVRYCGCDGKTFETSGSCPGQRFVSRGACR